MLWAEVSYLQHSSLGSAKKVKLRVLGVLRQISRHSMTLRKSVLRTWAIMAQSCTASKSTRNWEYGEITIRVKPQTWWSYSKNVILWNALKVKSAKATRKSTNGCSGSISLFWRMSQSLSSINLGKVGFKINRRFVTLHSRPAHVLTLWRKYGGRRST